MSKDLFKDIFSKSRNDWDELFSNLFSDTRAFIQKNSELSCLVGVALGFLIAQSVSLFLTIGALILIFIFVLWSIAPDQDGGEQ